MKLWRKLGNKVAVKDQQGNDVILTGRQIKHQNQLLSGGKDQGSSLLLSLVKNVPYVSPYGKD